MEQLMRWIVELNMSHHVEFAILTVLTMLGMGIILASLIELLFIVIGVRSKKSYPNAVSKHISKMSD